MPVQHVPSLQKRLSHLVRLSSIPILGAALLFLYQAALLLHAPTGHDQRWLLYAAQRLLSGAELYGPRVSETNPPLVIWFSTISDLLARLLHASPPLALRLVVLAMIVASVAWCVRILRRSRVNIDRSDPAGNVSLVLMACAILFVECNTGPLDFGQREQLLLILALPYILATASGAAQRLSTAERCALGVAIGFAVCLKPQQLVLLIAIEFLFALRSRSLRHLIAPEFVSAVATGAVYLLLVRLLTPLYFQETVPLLLNTYWAFGPFSFLHLALGRKKLTLFTILLIPTCYAGRKMLRDHDTPVALLVCSLAAYVAFDLQRTNWVYQHFPCTAFLQLAVACLLIDLLSPAIAELSRSPRLSMQAAVSLPGLLLVLFCAISLHSQRPQLFTPKHLESERLLEPYGPGTTVYIFSTTAEYFPDVVSRDLHWGSRFVHLWMLPAIVQNQQGPLASNEHFKRLPPPVVTQLAAIQQSATTHDLDLWQPSVILVERCTVQQPCQGIDKRNFNIIPWFLQDPGFAAAWSHYQLQQTASFFDVYTRTR